MKLFLLSLEFLVSVILIILILLHSAKGEGLGAIGGQARMFSGQKHLDTGLTKITALFGVLFIALAIILSFSFS